MLFIDFFETVYSDLLVRVAKDALQLLDLARVLHHVVEGPLGPEELLGRAHPVGRR